MTNPENAGKTYLGAERVPPGQGQDISTQGNLNALNGAQISALQKQVMERLHAAVNDVELRKIALQAAIQLTPNDCSDNNLKPGDPLPLARAIYAFLAEPAAEIKLYIGS